MSFTATNTEGLITFEMDEEGERRIQKALNKLGAQAPRALKNAVNKTAKKAKEDLAKKAQETYVVKKTRFAKAMKTENATLARQVAIIHVTGEQLELKDYKVSPASVRPKNPPKEIKGKTLKSGSMKSLLLSDETKDEDGNKVVTYNRAFVARFSNGHVSVVQRRTDERFPLRKFISSSIPVMVGSQERVYGILEPKIYDHLQECLQAEIRKAMAK